MRLPTSSHRPSRRRSLTSLDTLVGISSQWLASRRPATAIRFALRRAALGVLRIHHRRANSTWTYAQILAAAAEGLSKIPAPEPTTAPQESPSSGVAREDTVIRIRDFILERLRGYFAGAWRFR